MVFGLIFGSAYVATDEPHGISMKLVKKPFGRHQNLTDSGALQLGRSQGTIDQPNLNIGSARLQKYKKLSSDLVSAKSSQQHSRQSFPRAEKSPTLTNRARLREVTAYNVGDPAQNYGDPCESANGEDICAALDAGSKRCAANFVPFGTQLHIAHFGVCTVTDRMNRRYANRVDIAMKKNEKKEALRFGLRQLKVTVLATRDG
jgi:3D (Asp-Asp-Asp) domain-containing protein